ncbi:MAG: DUF853 domain-containing protein [Solirubrobacteraceae bacterium]|nr:DUF853 domain-containing protein [Solirubrobacteraceae bacterium]
MPERPDFAATITAAYASEGPAIDLGRGVLDGELHRDAVVRAPLAMLTRHGLIAGATGTGKTKTLQGIAEQLSAAGVPVVVADMKGDLTGLLEPGAADGPGAKRSADLGIPWEPSGFPVELFSIGGIGPGVPIRATVSDFGPQLLAKVLRANATQESSLALVFHYADQKGLPLLDLADLRALLTWLDSKDGKADLEGIGGLSKQTVGVLLRNLVALETGGGTEFFGEPQLDIADLLRTAGDGRGVISCVELAAVQDRPQLFSTVLMWLVAELFETLPEEGDVEQPKLVFFLDEAHLLFDEASEAFTESVTQTVRLIRSKGIGVFFVTQSPKDIPADVLGQLGNRIQHALRAFTPDDQKALNAAVKTYPKSDFYDVERLLQELGIGEAAVTILDEKGVPTPVVHSRLPGTRSLMDTASADLAQRRSGRATARPPTRRARVSCSPSGWRRRARRRPPRPRSPPRGPLCRSRRPRRAGRATRSGTSWAAARASSCRRRSCAGSSGC